MAVIDGNRVSDDWGVVLTRARKDGVRFLITDGRRTMAEQAQRYAYYKRFGRPLAAIPSPTAPHIRAGRADHALDVNSLDGGEARLQAWLERQGCHPTNPVRDEKWHLELPAGELKLLAARFTVAPQPVLRRGSTRREAIGKAQRWLRAIGFRSVRVNGRYDIATRRAVRRFQAKHQLPVDGVLGPRTWATLDRRVHA